MRGISVGIRSISLKFDEITDLVLLDQTFPGGRPTASVIIGQVRHSGNFVR
jgi:hypothetical protein